MKLSFHGADHTVTGSCHLVEVAGRRILIDCGMLQGSHEIAEENEAAFGFEAAAIDCVLLTHAHLDHCGRLPLLAKRGFTGEIVATRPTRELTRLVLLDAAHLQDEEARRNARQAHRRGRRKFRPPLFSLIDAMDAMDRFGREARYGEAFALFPGVTVSFHDAGHILGSASVLLEAREGAGTRRLLFSGDIGSAGRPLLRTPVPPAQADAVVMETTYGDRLHRPYRESATELREAILAAFSRGGNVVIPTFALERAQEILFVLRQDVEAGLLPRSMPVFLDSPMAISATEIFGRHPECYGPEVAALFRAGRDPFELPGLQFTRDVAESMAINHVSGGAVILAGSGMCTGGRVRHHLRHNLWRADSAVVFVGFAAGGTLARRIIDGARSVKLWGEDIPVRASVHTINGFSAHADQRELLAWHRQIGSCGTTFLVHGEEKAMQAMAAELAGQHVELPTLNQEFEL